MNNKEIIAVILAEDDGKIIQREFKVNSPPFLNWETKTGDTWDFVKYKYRIKPEPFECWVIVQDKDFGAAMFKTKEDAELHIRSFNITNPDLKVIHMRQVD